MFQKIDQQPIDQKEPWKGDLFQRSVFGETLCTLLKSTSHSSVIGINAPYGFGKTYFLLRLREQIKNEHGWAVYVNAWEHDYLDNPLLALLDALKTAAGELHEKKDIAKTLKGLGKAVAPVIAKAAGKKILEKAIGADGSKDIIDAAAEATGKTAEFLVNRYLNDSTTNQSLNAVRSEISKFVASHLNVESPYKTLIFIVDELDRAKPNYAIRFLETIKHLFGLSQVIFIIGCDRSILTSSAQHEYGSQLPTEGYFRRLFDFWIDLPPPKPKQYVAHCAERLHLFEDEIFTNDERTDTGIRTYAEFLLLGRRPDESSLRFIEQSVAQANLVLRLAPVDRRGALIGWLQGLKQFDPGRYDLYTSNARISEVYEGMKTYQPYISSRDFFKAWIILWATNNKEILDQNLLRKLIGEGQPLYSQLFRIASDLHVDTDDVESMASRIDRRMRTVTLND